MHFPPFHAGSCSFSFVALNQLCTSTEEYRRILDQQELSQTDVERIHMERKQLKAALESATTKKESLSSTVWQKEIEVAEIYDSCAKTIEEYTSMYRNVIVTSFDNL